MNFLQLVQRLCVESGASGTGPATTIGQTGEYSRMVNWVNDAWLDIQSMHQDWGWLRTSASFSTVTSQGPYPISSIYNINGSIGLEDFGKWDIDTFRNYQNPPVQLSISSPCVVNLDNYGLNIGDTIEFQTTGSLPAGVVANQAYYVNGQIDVNNFTFSLEPGGESVNSSGSQSGTQTITSNNMQIFTGMRSEIFMDPISYDEWRDMYLYGALRNTTSRPLQLAIRPQDKSVCVGPIPISGYTVTGDYFKEPAYMQNDSDIPALPSQWHMSIVWAALETYGLYEKDDGVISYAKARKSKFMRQMTADRLPQITGAAPLA